MDLVRKKVGLRRYKLLVLLAIQSLTCVARMPLMTLEKNLVAVSRPSTPPHANLVERPLLLLDQSNHPAHKDAENQEGAFL